MLALPAPNISTKKNGLPDNYNINIFNLENKIVFSSDAGFYTYDELSNKIYQVRCAQ